MLAQEKMWFHRALSVATGGRWLTPQAHIVGYGDEEVFVAQGDALYTIERVSCYAAALVNEDGQEVRRWMI